MRRSLEAVPAVFAARGFEGTSIGTVAERAGLDHQGAPAGPRHPAGDRRVHMTRGRRGPAGPRPTYPPLPSSD
ncbi:hypothetical protein [Streptomyces cacaoi]|uniref:hypothetical protein n=1 Tax=Streptomyces cacaoi TaxID=1898 RepID=UPI00374959E6